MTRSRSPRGAWVIVVALFAVACSAGADRSAAGVEETPAASAADATDADTDHGPDHEPTHQDQHDGDHADDDDHDAQHDSHDDGEAAPAGLGGLTTQETLSRFAAIDPVRLAGAHDHGAGHRDHREVEHPNGIDPERIVIPAIGVDADVIDLGLDDGGSMEVPSDFAQAGWFAPGVPPGRVGPAVIAGHVDSRSGPAVFFRLTELETGDEIHVLSDEGEEVTFVVRSMEQHAKDAFPTEKVYSGTPGPELRLITCGGVFDQGERSYRDNIIVYAERVDV